MRHRRVKLNTNELVDVLTRTTLALEEIREGVTPHPIIITLLAHPSAPTCVTLQGPGAGVLARELGHEPSEDWYVTLQEGDRLRMQRNYRWQYDGVDFLVIATTDDAGIHGDALLALLNGRN